MLLYVICAVAIQSVVASVPRFVWIVLLLGFNTTANFLGIETTARLNKILMVMQLAFLGLFMILAIFALSRGIAGRSCPSSRCTGLLRSARA